MKTFFTSALLLLAAADAHAQILGGVVFDPTQAAHAVTQIAQGENLVTNTISLAQTTIQMYNLAMQMASAPGSLYAGYMSPSTYWMLLESTANTYGNSQAVMDSANSGNNADAAYPGRQRPALRPTLGIWQPES